MVTRSDDGQPPEPPGVAQHEHVSVVEHQPDPDVRPGGADLALWIVTVEDAQDPRHPEMDDQLRRVCGWGSSEREQQELAAPAHVGDAATDGALDVTDAAGGIRVAGGRDDGPADDQRGQLSPDGFDLRQLGHTSRLVVAPPLPSGPPREEVDVPDDARDRPPHLRARTDRDRRDDGRPEQSRPRDRTGRPLPAGTVGVTLIEPVEPATVEEALVIGVARWDAQRYFEAHELLEFAWKLGPPEDRDLWKGVIQVAVAGVHLQRGNRIGARRLLDRALERLAGQPDVHRGVDVVTLRRTAGAARDVLDAGGVPTADWGPFPSRPDGGAPGVWFAVTADATGPAVRPTPVPS